MSNNNFGNVGDRRAHRDPTANSALRWRLENPEAAAAQDAATAAQNAALAAEQRDAIYGATARRIEALAAQFGEWAVVADVLASEGLSGDALATELAKCQTEAPSAPKWMQMNF